MPDNIKIEEDMKKAKQLAHDLFNQLNQIQDHFYPPSYYHNLRIKDIWNVNDFLDELCDRSNSIRKMLKDLQEESCNGHKNRKAEQKA